MLKFGCREKEKFVYIVYLRGTGAQLGGTLKKVRVVVRVWNKYLKNVPPLPN